jgi:hypothetical protein
MDDPLPRERQYASHEHEYDGRPTVGWREDRLLERLIRYHAELTPPKLMKQLAANRGRVTILASASD